MAYLVTCNFAEDFVKSTRNINGNSKKIFEKLSTPVSIISLNYIVAQNFPLKDEFIASVSAMFESGVRGKWRKDFIEEIIGKISTVEEPKSPLTLTDLKIPFIAFVIGNSLALIIFTGEFLIGRIWRFYRHIASFAFPN